MQEAGKGDQRRPTDQESFSINYDVIFGKKKPVEVPQENTRDKSTEADTAL